MAAPNAYTRGIDEKVFVQLETNFRETAAALPAATDAIRHLRPCTITPGDPKVARDDQRNTRSVLEFMDGKVPPSAWRIRKYILPGGVGVDPDDFACWQAGFGSKSGQTFTLKDDITDSLRVSLYRGQESRVAMGAMANRVLIEAPDVVSPRVEFSGLHARALFTGSGDIASGTTGLDDLEVDPEHGRRLEVDSLVTLRDTAGAGTENDVQVASISLGTGAGGADQIGVVGASLPDTYDAADVFFPAEPASMTTGGSPIPASRNSVTIDGVGTDIEMVSARFELVNNHQMRDRERGQKYATGFSSGGTRQVTVAIGVYHKSVVNRIIHDARNRTPRNVVITLGDIAGQRLVLTTPAWVPNVNPNQDEVEHDQIMTFEGMAISAGSAPDEISADFT